MVSSTCSPTTPALHCLMGERVLGVRTGSPSLESCTLLEGDGALALIPDNLFVFRLVRLRPLLGQLLGCCYLQELLAGGGAQALVTVASFVLLRHLLGQLLGQLQHHREEPPVFSTNASKVLRSRFSSSNRRSPSSTTIPRAMIWGRTRGGQIFVVIMVGLVQALEGGAQLIKNVL